MTARTVKADPKRLVKRMGELGLSVDALARKVGCSPKTIANACNGRGIYKSTLGLVAEALGVEGRELMAWEDGDDSATYRIQIVIRADSKKLEQSPVIHRFVDLLQMIVQTTDAFQLEGITQGSTILWLATSRRNATQLAELFPDFDEHSREAIRRTSAGRAYFYDHVMPSEQADEVREMMDLIDAVAELRVPVGDSSSADSAGQVVLDPVVPPEFPDPASVPQRRRTEETGSNIHLADLEFYLDRLKEKPPSEERDAQIAQVKEEIAEVKQWRSDDAERNKSDT